MVRDRSSVLQKESKVVGPPCVKRVSFEGLEKIAGRIEPGRKAPGKKKKKKSGEDQDSRVKPQEGKTTEANKEAKKEPKKEPKKVRSVAGEDVKAPTTGRKPTLTKRPLQVSQAQNAATSTMNRARGIQRPARFPFA